MKTTLLLLCPLVLALAPATQAATRASANYSLTTETLDGGGTRTLSAGYLNDGSLGGIGGLSFVPAPSELARHGYIGQLSELLGLRLTAANTNINEGTTMPLTAMVLFDDATIQALAGSQVTWSVLSGPLITVDANGLATASLVYESAPATVGGAYQGAAGLLGLQVVNFDPDNFGSYALDGVDDAWQVGYFGLDNPLGLAGFDPDWDGQINSFEYIAGTIPTNATSRFRFRIEAVADQPTQKLLVFSPRWEDRSYAVEYRINVDSGIFQGVAPAQTNDHSLERTVTDLNATDDGRFYRVRITWP